MKRGACLCHSPYREGLLLTSPAPKPKVSSIFVWLRLNGLLGMMSAFIFGTKCLQPAEQNTMAKKKSRQQKQNKTEIPKNEKNKAEGNQKSRKTCQK